MSDFKLNTSSTSRSTESATPWLVHLGPKQSLPRLRLYCFTYAGGSASIYRSWRSLLDPAVELCAVQLPGRGMRMSERPERDLYALVQKLAAVIAVQRTMPFAFFGHSLGALVAFELTRQLKLNQLMQPAKLIVSGCAAPQARNELEPLDEYDDDKLIERLSEYNGTPPEVLEHRELMRLLAPAIRADFALAAEYAYKPAPLLDIPITVLAGRSDGQTSPEQVDAWQRETTAKLQQHWFDGDHFFLRPEQNSVLGVLNSELKHF